MWIALAALVFWIAWSRGLSASVSIRSFDTAGDLMDDPQQPIGVHPIVFDFAAAIASAEGYGVPGAVPTRANNPGDLNLGDVGYGVTGTEHITVFANAADGWDRLYRQLQRIVDGRSHVYRQNMTIAQIADKWTDTASDAWTHNVVAHLRAHGYPSVTADTSLRDLL